MSTEAGSVLSVLYKCGSVCCAACISLFLYVLLLLMLSFCAEGGHLLV